VLDDFEVTNQLSQQDTALDGRLHVVFINGNFSLFDLLRIIVYGEVSILLRAYDENMRIKSFLTGTGMLAKRYNGIQTNEE